MIKKDKFTIETFIDDFFILQIDYAGDESKIIPLEETKKIKKKMMKKKKKKNLKQQKQQKEEEEDEKEVLALFLSKKLPLKYVIFYVFMA